MQNMNYACLLFPWHDKGSSGSRLGSSESWEVPHLQRKSCPFRHVYKHANPSSCPLDGQHANKNVAKDIKYVGSKCD